MEYRAEAALALGRHAEVVPELERRVAAHPLRENAVRLLALAHYRTGRQAEAGWQVAVGRCPETHGDVPPAWAWTEVLRALTAAHPPEPRAAARLAPLLGDGGTPAEGRFWLAQAVGDYLEGVPGPLLIVLEDVHRADDETLRLLRHLAGRSAALPALVVLTHRPAEGGEDLPATGAALAVQTAENVTLGGLAEDEVRRLLLERSGVDADPETVRTVTERTGGNPLFVAEPVRRARSSRSPPAERVQAGGTPGDGPQLPVPLGGGEGIVLADAVPGTGFRVTDPPPGGGDHVRLGHVIARAGQMGHPPGGDQDRVRRELHPADRTAVVRPPPGRARTRYAARAALTDQ